MNQPEKTWQERFDEEVPFITEDAFICANCGSTFVRDGYNKENKFDLMCKNCNESAVMTPILFAKKECKSFIQELIKEEKESIPVEAIERMLVNPNQGAYAVNAVYVSPAQRLRNEAERMEQQESDYYVVKEWLQSLREKIEKGEL